MPREVSPAAVSPAAVSPAAVSPAAVSPAAVSPAPVSRAQARARRNKRILDLTLGSLLAILSLPVVAVLALASAAALRSWPFFTQERPGLNGRAFGIVKIRTLPPSTPKYLSKHDDGFKQLPVPRVCELMRRLHLDELPQLWLVPVGRMSLVGPRPRLPLAVEPVDPAFDRVRAMVRPGCTGLWQVSPACDEVATGAPEYDLSYLRMYSARLDLWVLVRTVLVLSRLAGPVRHDQIPNWVRGPGLVSAADIRLAGERVGAWSPYPLVASPREAQEILELPHLPEAFEAAG